MCCGTHVTNLSQVQVNGCPSYFVVCKAVKTSLCSSTRRETKKSWEQDCEVLFVTKCLLIVGIQSSARNRCSNTTINNN